METELVHEGKVSPAPPGPQRSFGNSEQCWLQLLERISKQDQAALESLYQQTHRLVFHFVMKTLNDPEGAEEVTMDVFLQVWSRSATYDPRLGTVYHWILGMARSRAIDFVRYHRRAKRRDPVVDPTMWKPGQHEEDPY